MSWALMAFSLSSWGALLSPLASSFAIALFWHAIRNVSQSFWLASLWFFSVQLVQIGWLATAEYMGSGIYVVYALLSAAIGCQFGGLTQLVGKKPSFLVALSAGCFWIVMEWMRILPLTGFTWNPIGLILAENGFSIQMASLFGIYGLSFWVIFSNVLAKQALDHRKGWMKWALVAVFPYFFGYVYINVWESQGKTERPLQAALVQTALMPEEKEYTQERAHLHIPPLEQWHRILLHLKKTDSQEFDLIALPEGAVPWTLEKTGYPYESAREIWTQVFGDESIASFPPKIYPYAREGKNGAWRVSNAFWAQSIANHFHAELIVGLLGVDASGSYNSAYYFRPKSDRIFRYDKRMLVPLGEYLPFPKDSAFAHFVTDRFGIGLSFDAGLEARLFEGLFSIGISICSEEVYSDLIRDQRVNGATLFVNIANDAWFPDTELPELHYLHARIRAVENGVCALRAANTGISGAIDCFGRDIKRLKEGAGAIAVSIRVQQIPTLFTAFGDKLVLFVSFGPAIWLCRGWFRKKKLPEYGALD